MNRNSLMKLHMLMATFMLPVALMFLITGALYTWGIKGHYDTTEHELSLAEPLTQDLSLLKSVALAELRRLQIEPPSGKAGVKTAGTSFRLEWTGSRRDVLLAPTDNPSVARLSIKETRLHRHFVQLHKAKGGQGFKIYAAVFATTLLLILISGSVLAWKMPRYRKMAAISLSAGFLTFIILVMTS
ncbi:MAG: hypothetical protein ACR2QU_03880 [Gammaproteobacteria bacterium]